METKLLPALYPSLASAETHFKDFLNEAETQRTTAQSTTYRWRCQKVKRILSHKGDLWCLIIFFFSKLLI